MLLWTTVAAAQVDAPADWSPGSAPPLPLPAAAPVGFGCPIPAPPPLEPLPATQDPDTIDVLAGGAEVDLKGLAEFKDQITIRRGQYQINADGARFNQASGEFEVPGNAEFRDPNTWVTGRAARYNTTTSLFSIEDAEFELFSLPARGTAATLTVEQARELTLTDVTYTTCARGKNDWRLRAGTLSVNRETGTATARNARLEFKGVPILYSPYLTYPVDGQRKSGLLLPDIGNSDQRGVELSLPYYFNLAPNYDATLTAHYMSKRGLQAIGEFRYLTEGSEGVLGGAFLPDDDPTDEDRTLLAWFNQTDLPAGWRGTVDYTDVSDPDYFQDLGTGLASTSQTTLRRGLYLEYFANGISTLLRVEDYQNLDQSLLPVQLPYEILPQLMVAGSWPRGPLGLAYGFESELAYFDRDVGTTGMRGHLYPEVSLPLRFSTFYVEPNVAVDLTAYDLDREVPGEPTSPGRAVPVYSVDLGTILEGTWGDNRGWVQTVEPRVQYVYVPYDNQDDLPVFDTIGPDFSLVQLFRTNRYVGLDRLSNANQLSVGVTTRLIQSDTGRQVLTGTIGETQYFTPLKVVLPGEAQTDDSASDYLAELGMNLNDRWNVDLGYQWDSDQNVTELAEARVLYTPDAFRVVSASYRYRRDSIKEVDVGAVWPLGDRWSFVGRYEYSLLDNEPLASFVGLEYATCCWGVRVIGQRYLTNRDGDYDSSVTLQLLLKGFGSAGTPAERVLERGTLGEGSFDRY